MSDTQPTSARLEALRARWQADRGSRVFLQLADEYRRLGRSADAVAVLEEGLQANPTHPAARVLLGRCRLDLGQTAEAIPELEKVIETDPTQMVAYRLLVDAYLGEGRADLARQRLRVYSLLNDSDPEIADLRRRIGELDRQGPEAPTPPTSPVAPPPASTGSAEPTELAERPEEPFGMSEPPPPPRESTSPPPAFSAEGEPFPTLDADEAVRHRYLDALGSEGLFAVPPGPEPAAGVAEEGVQAAPEEAPESFEVPEVPELPAVAEAPEAPPPDVFELGAPAAAPPADLSSLLGPEADTGAEPAPREAVAAPPAPPAGAELEPAELAEPAPEEPPEPPMAPALAEAEARPARAEAPAETAGRATVTLGRLYLRQGHLAEAEEIFQQVLEADPDNVEARQGLEELAAARRPELVASELLAGFTDEPRGEGLTDRKRYVLERYLERLRAKEPGDVH